MHHVFRLMFGRPPTTLRRCTTQTRYLNRLNFQNETIETDFELFAPQLIISSVMVLAKRTSGFEIIRAA